MIENDPYTRIHNTVLEALARADLSGAERRVLDVIFRQTYGYQKKESNISQNLIVKATSLNIRTAQRILLALQEKKFIKRSGTKTSFSKDFMKLNATNTPYGQKTVTVKMSQGHGQNDQKVRSTDRPYKERKKTIKETATQKSIATDQDKTVEPATSHSKSNPIVKFPKVDYDAVIGHLKQAQGIKLMANYPKQTKFIKILFEAGYSVAEVNRVITQMQGDEYWQSFAFDMANVYKNIHKYSKPVVEAKPSEEEILLQELETPEMREAIDNVKRKMRELNI